MNKQQFAIKLNDLYLSLCQFDSCFTMSLGKDLNMACNFVTYINTEVCKQLIFTPYVKEGKYVVKHLTENRYLGLDFLNDNTTLVIDRIEIAEKFLNYLNSKSKGNKFELTKVNVCQ